MAALSPLLSQFASARDFDLKNPEGGIESLSLAWNTFCDELKKAGEIPLAMTLPNTERDRTTGYLQLFRNLSLAFDFHYEFNDPLFPEFFRYFGPTRKQGGDNSDCIYVGATVNGQYNYRISGDRGTSKYFSIVLVEEGKTPWGGKVTSRLFGQEIVTDDHGQFELIISPDKHEGNWLQSNDKTFRVTIRQYFADWENERPMYASIERISGPEAVTPLLSPEKLAKGLVDSVQWLQESVVYWSKMLERWQQYRNQFKSYWQLEENAIDATPGGDPLVCYWELDQSEAIIIRVKPPACQYWSVEFGDCWWETVDYRYRLANTNMHYAQLESDGELIVVASHTDPGIPNWLDCSGFSRGYVTYRWMLSDEHPVPAVKQVKLRDLYGHLPSNVKRIDEEGRKEQIRTRRSGVLARFGY